MKNRVPYKIFNKKGVSLAEVLITVAIMAIFVSMAAVGTSALFGTGEEMMNVSKSAVLGSDVLQIITNEIRYGENVSTVSGDGGVLTDRLAYNSSSYGEGCTMFLDGGKLVINQKSTKTDISGNKVDVDRTFTPIGDVAYGNVKIVELAFGLDDAGVAVNVSVKISDGDSGALWENSVSVVPLYKKV